MKAITNEKSFHNIFSLWENIKNTERLHVDSYTPLYSKAKIDEILRDIASIKDKDALILITTLAENSQQGLPLKFDVPREYESDFDIFSKEICSRLASKAGYKFNRAICFENNREELRAYFDLTLENGTDRTNLARSISTTWKRHVIFKKNFVKWLELCTKEEENHRIQYTRKLIDRRRHSLGIDSTTIIKNEVESITDSVMFSHEIRSDIFKEIKDAYRKNSSTKHHREGKQQTNVSLSEDIVKKMNDYISKNKMTKNEFIEEAILEYINYNK